MNENMLPVGTVLRAGAYRIERQIGAGGFGNTYVVRNLSFDEVFAMKEFFMKAINLRDGSDVTVSIPSNKATFESQRNKFKKEAKRLRKLDNPHIVKVYDLFEENGTVYYVMDLIDGRSLNNIVKTDGPMNESAAMNVFRQMLDALKVVHNQEPMMLHLDIKPSNIMLDKSGNAFLLDFGSSKLIDLDNSNSTTGFTFSPNYAPPELIDQNKNRMGPWTDLYELGATLYHILTGQQPPTASEILENGENAFNFPETTSKDTRKLILWLMASSRAKRPKTVEDVQKLFEQTGVDPEPKPRPEPKPESPKPPKKTGNSSLKIGVTIITTLVLLFFMKLLLFDNSKSKSSDSLINPRDTVVVPEWLTGEDSIAYIENAILQSPISVEDLLGLMEVHSIEQSLSKYDNSEMEKEDPEYANEYRATHRDSAAMRLANRFMRMSYLVNKNGKANDKLQWFMAVNAIIDTFRVAVPSVPKDSVIDEITRVVYKFSEGTQRELNFQSYINATLDYYHTIEAYHKWIQDVPSNLKVMVQEEYEAWHDLNNARFALWSDVSYSQSWYSMKPMEIEGYYENLSSNRRAELEVERSIILANKPYYQKGKTVTTQEWEKWIADNSVPEDLDLLKELENEELIPSDSLVNDRVSTLKSSFSKWLKARHAISNALPKEQRDSYDNMTADIHSRFIGKLKLLVPLES